MEQNQKEKGTPKETQMTRSETIAIWIVLACASAAAGAVGFILTRRVMGW